MRIFSIMEKNNNPILYLLVICFILCWTPYYCIVFFLLITDARVDHEHPPHLSENLTLTTPLDPSIYDQPSRDQRSLLIVMMLAVSNSVLDPLIYGNWQNITMKEYWFNSLSLFRMLFSTACEIELSQPAKNSNWNNNYQTSSWTGTGW